MKRIGVNFLRVCTLGAFATLVGAFTISDEPEFLRKLKSSLTSFLAQYPEEKVFLQTDKMFYKPGEDIWFSVLVLNSETHKPSMVSDVVYVELIDPRGQRVAKSDLVIKEGRSHGDFALPPEMPGGPYQVRAYTQWMMNFDQSFKRDILVQPVLTPRLLLKWDFVKQAYGPGDIVEAELRVSNLKNEHVAADIEARAFVGALPFTSFNLSANTEGLAILRFNLPDSLSTTDVTVMAKVTADGTTESIGRAVPVILGKLSVTFYPEGGKLLTGARSRIAFKSVNEFGKGADIEGRIVDNQGQTVGHFESFHKGMGAFDLKASPDESYYAVIEKPAGHSELLQLPAADGSGFALRLESARKDSTNWTIHATDVDTATLVGHIRGNIIYEGTFALHRGSNPVSIATRNCPRGVAVFTLFDQAGVPHSERLVFLGESNGLQVSIQPDKKQYYPRDPVRLKVITRNGKGELVRASLSLVVTDDQLHAFADDRQDNLESHMFLSSEIKGKLEEPSFYFNPEEPKASQAIDFVMLTHGWRRFTWKALNESREIHFAKEKVTNLIGRLHDDAGVGVEGDVTLVELGSRKRVVQVKTTPEGHFMFRNIDPRVSVMLLTKKGNVMTLSNGASTGVPLFKVGAANRTNNPVISTERAVVVIQTETNDEPAGLDVSLGADVKQLTEVVVTAQGIASEKKALGYAVSISGSNQLANAISAPSLEQLLAGRIPGVAIYPQFQTPGTSPSIQIRGYTSLHGGRAEPLYVINGTPITPSLSQNFSNGSFIGPEEIKSIDVISSPEAIALYGELGTNGVINITTYSYPPDWRSYWSDSKPRFSSLIVPARSYTLTREFFAPNHAELKDDQRSDFRTTVYWNPNVLTNERGEAEVKFHSTDAITAFRVTAEGIDGKGLVGRKEATYHNFLPLSMDVKLPEYLGYNDILRLPVRLRNETDNNLQATINVHCPKELALKEPTTSLVAVPAKSLTTHWLTISPRGIPGDFPITLEVKTGLHSDHVLRKITVHPAGFPSGFSASGRDMDKVFEFVIGEAENNTIQAELVAFPDPVSELFTGAEALIREPHGCFEQVSSTTFPNILALQYLKATGKADEAVETRALGLIEDGYKLLAGYEVKGGGFEWFGHPPANEGLTAYGLLEFTEMTKVYGGVEEKMITRTRDWLMSRRDGNGGFLLDQGKYGWQGNKKAVMNAYIVYALSVCGVRNLGTEFRKAASEALSSKDMYRKALLALTAFELNDMALYGQLTSEYMDFVETTPEKELPVQQTLVCEYGESRQVETLALWALALMKSKGQWIDKIDWTVRRLLDHRAYGYFGSTQATVLSLKALTEYALVYTHIRQSGTLRVVAEGSGSDSLQYGKDTRGRLSVSQFGKGLASGAQRIRVKYSATNQPLPYTLNVRWSTMQPASSEKSQVNLEVAMSAKEVKLNERVRLTARVINRSLIPTGMAVASLGIPAGLSLQPWQLRQLMEKRVVDFYEVLDNCLVLYFTEMGPSENKTIALDLIGEIPGTFTGRPSSAYLYYTPEYKRWLKSETISVKE